MAERRPKLLLDAIGAIGAIDAARGFTAGKSWDDYVVNDLMMRSAVALRVRLLQIDPGA